MLLGLLALHLVAALVAAAAGRRLGRAVFWVCAVAPAAAVVWAYSHASTLLAGGTIVEQLRWVPSLELVVGMRLDAFSLLMVGLVSGVGVLIFAYAFWYFDKPRDDLGRFAAVLVAFAGSMLGLVTADNLLALFVFWELTSITSYLLIGFEHRKGSARAAALQALLVTGGGALVMLAGIVLVAQAAGTWSLAAVVADPPAGPLVTAGVLCMVVGIATKSAQVPFHAWLPGAMAAPTPVSAYLHAAAMVKAGVYLAARLGPAFAPALPAWRPTVVTLGVVTMLVGGYRALRQHDLKLLLAYGTVSQLGLLTALVGAGTEAAVLAAATLLLAHGAFKAALFMVVGVVDRSAGTRDLRQLSGLGRRLPGLAIVAGVAAASMAGLPPLAGYIAKEAAIEALSPGHGLTGGLAVAWLAGVVLGSALTLAYSWRLWWGAFGTRHLTAPAAHRPLHRPSAGFWAPAGLLAGLGLVLGLVPGIESPLVEAATAALVADARPHQLGLWHGFTVALGLTVVAVTLGVVLARAGDRVERLQGRVALRPSANDAYAGAIVGLNRVADRVAAVMQSGSLPVYLGVILTAVIVAPIAALAGHPLDWRPGYLADSWLQVAALLVAVFAAVGVVRARRRFQAVLALGAVGYSTVTLFALHGAPDLALTQLLIETLTLVVFVLVLQQLPAPFLEHHWRLSQAVRRIVAVAVGVFVTGFALVAGNVRTAQPVSGEFVARALDEAGGRNIVNVILVDFRGIDTLGEITVLAVAGLGIAALVLAPRHRERQAAPDAARTGDGESS